MKKQREDRQFDDLQHDAMPTAFGSIVSGLKSQRYNGRHGALADFDIDVVVELPRVQRSASGAVQSDDTRATYERVLERFQIARAVSRPAPTRRFAMLQQFEGTVTSIDDEEFTAVLLDLSDADRPEEEATFLLDEVSPGDTSLVVPGAKFRWSIGYRTDIFGQRERSSRIRFLRIPGWRRNIVEAIERDAKKLMSDFAPNRDGSD